MAEKKIFDKAVLLELLSGDEQLADSIVQDFLRDASQQFQGMKEAQARGEASQLSRQAHTLRSAAGSVGALEMQEVCVQLETAGLAQNLKKTATLVSALGRELAAFRRVLKEQGLINGE